MRAKRRPDVGAAALFAALYFLDAACLQISHWLPEAAIPGSHWNWVGKFASLFLGLGALAVLPRRAFDEVGLFRIPERTAWPRLLAILVGVVAFAVVRGRLGHEPFALEAVAFQATMPGLSEELAYRGIWWIILATAFDQPALDARRIPWSAFVVTTVLFASVHGVTLDAHGALAFDWFALAATSVAATLYGLLQAIGRALWLPIVAHNLSNVVLIVLQTS